MTHPYKVRTAAERFTNEIVWHGGTKCQICQCTCRGILHDARTIGGNWGVLCQSCWESHGVGARLKPTTGGGIGQRYLWDNEKKFWVKRSDTIQVQKYSGPKLCCDMHEKVIYRSIERARAAADRINHSGRMETRTADQGMQMQGYYSPQCGWYHIHRRRVYQ